MDVLKKVPVAEQDPKVRATNFEEVCLGYTLEDDSSGNEEENYYRARFAVVAPDDTEWGVIKDSTAKVNIKAPTANNVGGLVGQMDTEDGGEIINSSVIALNDTSKIEGYSNVGGLVGSNSYGNITDSHATINVKANSTEDANVGGLVGYNKGGSSSEYLEEEFISESYVSEEAAQNAVNDVRDAFIAAQLEANPGYELDYSKAGVWNYNNIPNTIVVEVILAKSIPTGAISNSYATGTVTSVGGNTGGLVGSAYETIISDSYATGAVIGTMRVGGLVGTMEEDSIIETSYSTGTVNGADAVGGLVGYATGSEIVDSYHTTGKVTGSGGTEGITGGLVGILYDNNSISGSYATSEVEGEAGVGGLIGSVYLSSVENSYATGKVTASGLDFEGVTSAYAGGLAGGFAFSSLTKSYATGEVIANGVVAGGLLGNSFQNESIEESYATGKVTGTSQVGGLIGKESGSTISNVYSSGEVVASGDSIGSLMGQADGTTLTNSYASGKITLTGEEQINVKGLIGNKDATVANSFYDKTVNAGMADEATYGKSTTELKTLATYTTDLEDAAWDMGGANGNYPTLDFSENRTNIWMMGEGNTGGGSSPVDPTPVKPTPEPEKEIEKVITTIVNNQQINVVLPVVTAPIMNFASPQSIVLNNNLALKLGISEGSNVSLVSSPQAGQESQKVSLNEISTGETKIALGGGSIIELVNSGVSLPEGVDQ
ncbi:MAG: GLUG motif-containing protein, partial [Prevotella sp.]